MFNAQKIADLKAQLETATTNLATVTQERDEAKTQLAAITTERDEASAQLMVLTTERDEARAALAAATTERDAALQRAEAAEKTVGQQVTERIAKAGVPAVQRDAAAKDEKPAGTVSGMKKATAYFASRQPNPGTV